MAKKQTKPPKFDYLSDEFLSEIESMATKGYTDKDIALGLVVKFGEILNPNYFKALKHETDENGEQTEVSRKISDALSRGRANINLAVRSTFLKLALGGIKTKSAIRKKIVDEDGNILEQDLIQETETELPPNLQALSVWLFNHDEEWREKVQEGKKLDITSGGHPLTPPKVEIEITYNQKEDLELQEKLNPQP